MKNSPLGSAARAITWPLRRFFGPQFQWVRDQVVESDHRIQGRIAGVEARIDALDRALSDRSESAAEALAQAGQELRVTVDWLEAVRDEMAILRERLNTPPGEAWRATAVRELVDAPVERLDAAAASLLNYAEGHRGFRAQRGLWFNEPISVTHRAGDVTPATVSERIVEVPYVYRALAGLERGAGLIDVGGAESTLGLSLASLGYRVTTVDLRPYPLDHPGLTAIAAPFESLDPPREPFDAAICLSSIEHFGVGAYGEAGGAGDADRRALDQLRTWLRPGGLLVLTVPFGTRAVTATERVYDREALDALLEGWAVLDLLVARRAGELLWELTDSADADMVGDDGVALVTARAPGE
jgi:SAM-dependent methyltransferase